MTQVVKKDGRRTDFHIEKIASNLDSAERVFGVTFKNDKETIINNINKRVLEHSQINSEEVLAIVKDELKNEPLVLLAFKEFKRVEKENLDRTVDLDYQLGRYHNKDKDIMNENGNKDSRTAMTQRDLLSGVVSKAKGLAMYPEDVRKAHLKGIIHLHDLDRSPYQGIANCSLPDFEYMLKNGLQLGNAKLESPKSLETAVSVLGILISALSSEQYGGISVHELDKLLAPYAQMTHEKNIKLYEEAVSQEDNANTRAQKIDDLARKKTIKDIYDAMQAFEYDINTMTTTTAQTPFSTVSYGLGLSWIEREIQKQHLQVRYDGLGENKLTAIFPKILYFIQDGINAKKEDPNYDIKKIAMRTSAKRIYPDVINVDDLMKLKGGKKPITAMGLII